MSTEDYQASQRGKHPTGKPPVHNAGKLVQTNVHLQNANATFNNFIDEGTHKWPSDIKSVYNHVGLLYYFEVVTPNFSLPMLFVNVCVCVHVHGKDKKTK